MQWLMLMYFKICQGKLILIDLGTAKVLGNSEKTSKTFTIIGTPHYMAPEILSGKGYNNFCDLWSIGNI